MPDEPVVHFDVHDGRGPHALIVHGVLSSRAQWMHNLAALSTVCRPVVVELLGHGRSPAPSPPDAYTPDAYVAELERVRRSLGVDRWLVIGQSLGAALTMRYVLDHPDRAIGHVFTNSASALAGPSWQARMAETIPEVADRVEAGGLAAIEAMPQHPSHARRLPADVKAALVADTALLDPHGVASTLRHTVPASSCRARAASMTVPNLLVVGRREEGFTSARRYAEDVIPDLTVVEADAGHAVNVAAAETFDRAVVEFVGRLT
jgi:pimeloyl-ACP methyl ester carboxylesterase